MKDYLNLFHSIIDKVHFWNELNYKEKIDVIDNYISKSSNNQFLVDYFEEYLIILSKNSLKSYLKSVSNP